MQNAEWKRPSCVSMKYRYQMFCEIPVHTCFISKPFCTSAWICIPFLKIVLHTVEVLRGTSKELWSCCARRERDPKDDTPVEESTLFTCESTKWHLCGVYCTSWKLWANPCWHQVRPRIRSPVSCKSGENAQSHAVHCAEVQHISLPGKLRGAQHSRHRAQLHVTGIFLALPWLISVKQRISAQKARYFCTETPFVVNFQTISQFHTGLLWK